MVKRRDKGFTLIELLIVVAIIGILAAIAIPNFLEAQMRAKVARAQSDIRNIATAIETYHIDNNTYPLFGHEYGLPGGLGNCLTATLTEEFDWYYGWLWTFQIRTPTNQIHTITTPVEYMSSIPFDPFGVVTASAAIPYGYWTIGQGYRWDNQQSAYILYSFGPDSAYQLNVAGDFATIPPEGSGGVYGDDVTGALNPSGGNPTQKLIHGSNTHPDNNISGAFTYDATNGTVSRGDIHRTGP